MKRYYHVTATILCDSPTVQHATSLSSHHDFDDTLLPRNSHATMQSTKMQPIYHVIFTRPLTGTVVFFKFMRIANQNTLLSNQNSKLNTAKTVEDNTNSISLFCYNIESKLLF